MSKISIIYDEWSLSLYLVKSPYEDFQSHGSNKIQIKSTYLHAELRYEN